MSNDNWTPPNLGSPPLDYDRVYFSALVRQLSVILDTLRSPGDVEASTINIADLPTSPSGLNVGQVWVDGDILRIVTGDIILTPADDGIAVSAGTGSVAVTGDAVVTETGTSSSTAVGTVTVVTP